MSTRCNIVVKSKEFDVDKEGVIKKVYWHTEYNLDKFTIKIPL